MAKKKIIGILLGVFLVISVAANGNQNNTIKDQESKVTNNPIIEKTEGKQQDKTQEDSTKEDSTKEDNTKEVNITEVPSNVPTDPPSDVATNVNETTKEPLDKRSESSTKKTIQYQGKTYKIITVDGGDLSGDRQANVAVDVGFGERVYWALTNEYGQLIHVIADKVVLQDDATEAVNSNGRYYDDEANVPGTEREDLDQGHVIADSLGGVSNAYNITPQNSTLNRHGDQAYMEKVIRDAGGCENFVATIYYSDSKTQIPSKYRYEYILNGNDVVDEFENVNPDKANEVVNSKQEKDNVSTESPNTASADKKDISSIDTNGNGIVTIAEAKAAGYAMPIYSDHWLYKYMKDNDGDGMVGE